jgi:hypothetical protein
MRTEEKVYFAKYYGCSYVCTHKTKVEASRDVGDLRGALLVAGRPTRQKRGAELGKIGTQPLTQATTLYYG